MKLYWENHSRWVCNFLQSKVSCCLHMYFLWRHHFPSDKSENDHDNDSDLHILLTYIWLFALLFSFQYLSESCFGNDNEFSYPTLELFCFSFTQPLSHSKFCLEVKKSLSLKKAPNMHAYFRANIVRVYFIYICSILKYWIIMVVLSSQFSFSIVSVFSG
jgi:hypothetical protein